MYIFRRASIEMMIIAILLRGSWAQLVAELSYQGHSKACAFAEYFRHRLDGIAVLCQMSKSLVDCTTTRGEFVAIISQRQARKTGGYIKWMNLHADYHDTGYTILEDRYGSGSGEAGFSVEIALLLHSIVDA